MVYEYTVKGNFVAVVTDGTAVLGLGNIGPEAALPVMEGKALLFKKFAGIDAVPICLNTQDVDEIIRTVKAISPTFGAVNLEDISAPRCFEIENGYGKNVISPYSMTNSTEQPSSLALVYINALKIVNKKMENIKIVINGARSCDRDCQTVKSNWF